MTRTKKDRRNSGRKVLKIYHPEELPYETVYWDNWIDFRDGMRGYNDHTKIMPQKACLSDWFDAKRWNKKNKRMAKIREARKNSPRNEK